MLRACPIMTLTFEWDIKTNFGLDHILTQVGVKLWIQIAKSQVVASVWAQLPAMLRACPIMTLAFEWDIKTNFGLDHILTQVDVQLWIQIANSELFWGIFGNVCMQNSYCITSYKFKVEVLCPIQQLGPY